MNLVTAALVVGAVVCWGLAIAILSCRVRLLTKHNNWLVAELAKIATGIERLDKTCERAEVKANAVRRELQLMRAERSAR